MIYGVLGDRRGRLWVTTNRGAARLDPGNGEVRTFDVSDGLQGNEFSVGAYHAGRSTMMYLGGVGGFSVFHPDSIEANTFVPPTVITAIRSNDQPLRPWGSIRRAGAEGEKYLTIEFAALDYTNPSKNRYAYRLQGFDERWTEAGTRRSVSFTNLDAGEYLFEVKGANSDGMWNDHPASLRIVVVPPFWRSTWFILLSGCATLVVGYVLYRRRLAADVEKARILGELQAAPYRCNWDCSRPPISVLDGPEILPARVSPRGRSEGTSSNICRGRQVTRACRSRSATFRGRG